VDGTGPRIAINGFGRIGRIVARILLEMDKQGTPVDLVGVNDVTDKKTLAHLFRYDSSHGQYAGNVKETKDGLEVSGDAFPVFSQANPADGLWEDLKPDLLIEASGHYTTKGQLQTHLRAGARRILVTAPAQTDIMVVRGVNDHLVDAKKHKTVSAASCTTNCLALVLKVLDESFGVDSGLMTTIHAATNDQRIVDAPHSDLRRARSSLMSMIPTKTGAASAIGKVLPKLDGKLDGQAVRIPTSDVSLVDLVAKLSNKPKEGQVEAAFTRAANEALKGLLGVSNEPLVSIDYLGNPHSAVIDLLSLQARGDLVKVLAWYDNEWGYATRVAELAHQMANQS
jgi:glyceraldehyde-3-phosphate dehydrogenase type I